MNNKLKAFLKIGLAVSKIIVPEIASAEQVFGGGSRKKAAVKDSLMVIPEVVLALQDKEVINKELFEEGLSEINDGLVKIMNSLASEKK